MDPIQAGVSLLQGAEVLLQGVAALARASRDHKQAPVKLSEVQDTLNGLQQLHDSVVQNYGNKLHHPLLYSQLQSLENLIRNFEVQVNRARALVMRRKKNSRVKYLHVVMNAVVGDELVDIVKAMETQLVEWIQKNNMKASIGKTFEKTARNLTTHLKVQPQAGYRPIEKAKMIREMLEDPSHSKVILIHGLSGMGKSGLARHIAADPPKIFNHGAVHLVLGQGCSRYAARDEYHSRLAAKFSQLLRVFGRKKDEVDGLTLEDACQMLQETLVGRNILMVLDDVWESDIIAKFTRLYDNGCRYLATTRNQSVYEITEAEKVEICKEDVQDLSKVILMNHSQLTEEELPDAAELLIQRCGHHPLTLAVIGKALRKETRPDQWEKAIEDLSMYASQAPVPVHYLNEKEVESTATVFGSFDYSLNSMVPHARELFIAFGALCWDGPIPEPCLEAIWYSLEQNTTFRLATGRLCEGSLLERVSDNFYQVHDMVALYLETKINEAQKLILKHSKSEAQAALVPWLYHFGHHKIRRMVEEILVDFFWRNDEDLPATVLWNIVDVLSTSSTMSELEAASVSFSRIIGPELARLFLLGSEDLHAAIARCMANCFTNSDYEKHTVALVQAGAPEKLGILIRAYEDSYVQRDAAVALARIAEFRQDYTSSEEVLKDVPLKELLELLDPNADEETQYSVIDSLITLAKAGEETAVEQIFLAGAGEKLEQMLVEGSEVTQQRAVLALKSFSEYGGGKTIQSFLSSGILERLPWQMKLMLQRLADSVNIFNYRTYAPPKRHVVLEQVCMLKDGTEEDQLYALAELTPVIDRAATDSQTMDTVLATNLIEVLASKLGDCRTPTRASTHRNHYRVKNSNMTNIESEACIALAKLSSGGPRCIKPMLKMRILENLLQTMTSSSSSELAYSTFHSLVFTGRRQVTEQLLRNNLVDKVLSLLDTSMETGLYCVQDLVEVGGKECIERLLALRVVDKLAALESRGVYRDAVYEFARLVRKCSGLSAQEHRVLNQQILRQARAVLKDPKQVSKISSLLSRERGEGSGSGSGSSSSKRRNSFSGSRTNSV